MLIADLKLDFPNFSEFFFSSVFGSKGLVEAFASKGFNVVLVSRTQAKLEAAAKELEKYKVETRVIAVDANSADVVRPCA